jgi:hypothetical protein
MGSYHDAERVHVHLVFASTAISNRFGRTTEIQDCHGEAKVRGIERAIVRYVAQGVGTISNYMSPCRNIIF